MLRSPELQSARDDAHQFTVMMLTVAAILDIIQIVAGLFAQQPVLLCTSYVKLLSAAGFVALHARSTGRF